jgi:PAS domain S-box-containing protein
LRSRVQRFHIVAAPQLATQSAGMTELVDAGIFEAWLASTDDGAIAIDASGRVLLHNPAASRVTGLAPNDARRRSWRDVLQLEPAIADMVWQVRERCRPLRATIQILCAQGNLRSADVGVHPWTSASGEIGLLVLVRDLSVLCRHRTGPGGRPGYGSLIGADPAMEALYDLIEAVAPSDASVIIEGEPGVGKELVAQMVHGRSQRAERPLVAVDCSAAPPGALEIELFGSSRVIGRVELAHSGSLFLDQVSEAPLQLQARLVRLLERGEIERAGDSTPRPVDVRVIAASSRPLEPEVAVGRFRPDLHRRLKVVRLLVPPLRDRRGDISLLADHMLARYGAGEANLDPAAVAVLQAYDWPGNVRQLESAIRHAIASRSVGRESQPMGPEVLPTEVRRGDSRLSPLLSPFRSTIIEDRRSRLLRALSSHGGNRTAAARALGIGRATFYRWWRDAGLGDISPT